MPLALATQTGGSTIRPASYCGIWGLKPTWGLVSNEGCKRYSPTLDTLGWYGRSADDLELLLDIFDAEPAPAPVAFKLAGVFNEVAFRHLHPFLDTLLDFGDGAG